MRSGALVRAALALAVLGVPAPAAANPVLPSGFVAPSKTLGKPTVRKTGRSSLQSNHESTFSARGPLPGAAAEIGALPVVDVEPADLADPLPIATLPAGGAGDLVVMKAGGDPRLSIQGFEAGVLRYGKANPIATGRQSAGGIPKACGPKASATGVTPLAYDALRRADDHGGLELVMARGWFDAASCKPVVARRVTVKPAHLGGGVVYAFKTRCVRCDDAARDLLHVLTPQSQKGKFDFFVPFEHHRLRLAPGVSAAFSGKTSPSSTSFNTWGLPDWDGLVKRQCAIDRTFCFTDIRFEVSWGKGEAVPSAFLAGDFLAERPAR